MSSLDLLSTDSEAKQATLARVKLDETWKQPLAEVLTSNRMDQLRHFLKQQKENGTTVYPPGPMIFNALDLTPLDKVKVVILGQDPYHGPRQANGLAFSVQRGLPLPPSLVNIYHELKTDLGINPAKHGDLTHWAEQGVLLINSTLTVEAGRPTSHQGQGWEEFTDAVIDVVNEQTEYTVFILWGSHAQRKGKRINPDRHLILKAAHPSPLSANRGGFFGCRVFSKANDYLVQHQKTPIDWQLN